MEVGDRMGNDMLEVNINPMEIRSITTFANINGRFNNFKKDVYFVRFIGIDEEEKYIKDILNMDRQLNDRKSENQIGYLRVERLEFKLDIEDASYYSKSYDEWNRSADGSRKLKIKFEFINLLWQNTMAVTYGKMIDLYKGAGTDINETMLKNFGVKLLYWIDIYLPKLFDNLVEITKFPKFVFAGDIKNQEYFFLYFLVLLGCDVLYINTGKDIISNNELLKLSFVHKEKNNKVVSIPKYEINNISKLLNSEMVREASNAGQSKNIANIVSRIDRVKTYVKPHEKEPGNNSTIKGRQLEYEEIAKLASSVVMIGVHNEKNECFKTGSGVIISEKGYILTNFHVACDASYYGIRMEDEKEIYETSEIVKYNQLYDLAILKIDRKCIPIPVYQSEKELVRGQKVVAIGSPLGLFNSVSDGIIAGFRNLDDVSMVQFTAPISHGSSGGALLDLYGTLVGIITAGFDDGQNLNLAVNHKNVINFVRGFI